MFNDAHLPDTDAWAAMTRDLRQSKEGRNALSKENSYVPEISPRAT
jgi:protein ECT2